MRTLTLLAAFWLLPFLAACESSQPEEPALRIQTPLPLDPTEHHEITGWWSNGTELLDLGRDSGFRFYSQMNRYLPPAERGSWWKQGYAVAWLEVYNDLAPLRVRVAISKIDGELALTIPDFAPMQRLDGPPIAPEDRFIGEWSGDSGSLVLGTDLRYSFTLSRTPGAPVTLAGHNGRWLITGDTIVLEPDSPTQRRVIVEIDENEDDVALALRDDVLRRVPDLAAPGA